jgi:hypothetical protein
MDATPVSSATPAVPPGLGFAALGAATYHGILDEAITLAGGVYEGEPFVTGGASRPTVTLLAEPLAYGDLDEDGQADVAVVLVSNSGGSGTYVYLAVVESRDGEPFNVATMLLGDREQVKSLVVENGRLVAMLLSHAENDPECCPTLEIVREFRLEQGKFLDSGE